MQLVIKRERYEAVSVSLCIRQTVYISLYLHPFDESNVFYVQNAVATYVHSLLSDVNMSLFHYITVKKVLTSNTYRISTNSSVDVYLLKIVNLALS